jgi:hypothetical protein
MLPDLHWRGEEVKVGQDGSLCLMAFQASAISKSHCHFRFYNLFLLIQQIVSQVPPTLACPLPLLKMFLKLWGTSRDSGLWGL